MQSGEPVVVAVPDSFDSSLLDAISKVLPRTWTMQTSDYEGPKGAYRDADVVFAMWAPVTASLMSHAPRLQLIQKLGAGIDRIDMDYCRMNGIAVARLAGVNAVPVAEHVVMLILAALRRLTESDMRMRRGEWFKEEARSYQRELRGALVGLVGVGHVGVEVARRLRPFEADLVYYDTRRLDPLAEADLGLRYASLDDLVSTAQVISLHVPLTDETRLLINRERIALMRKDAIVVNCARGGLIDEGALADAIRANALGGAALDTFTEEPLRSHDLVSLPSVVSTPHTAGATRDNFYRVVTKAIENAQRYLDGGGLPDIDAAFVPAELRS